MKRLIKWQFRQYRSSFFRGILVILICAAVAAWLSYTLLHLPMHHVVTVFRIVQWVLFLVAIAVHYTDIVTSSSVRDAGTLALHVPLPRWWGLLAKVLAILPILTGYIVIDTVLLHITPPDLTQLVELSLQQALFIATSAIFWGAVIVNALVVRTRLQGVLSPPWGLRFLERFPILRSGLCAGLDFVAMSALFILYMTPGVFFVHAVVASGFPVLLQALIVVMGGLTLTYVNGYLLERYIPLPEPPPF